MLKKGIILIATGSPYYGRMAYNLAMTIRVHDDKMPIGIIFDHSALTHLSSTQMQVFSEMIALPADVSPGFGVKTHLYDLSPYEETIFLDADMAWLPKLSPEDLFKEVQDVPFTAITEGYYDVHAKDNTNAAPKYYYWAKPEDICERWELTEGRIYQWRSEVMYFRRGDIVQNFFDTAKEVYQNHGLEQITHFANAVPDELAFNIAGAIHNIHPHRFKWQPSYWPKYHGESSSVDTISGKHYLLSCGSNYCSKGTKDIYNRVVSYACRKFGRQHLFPLVSKLESISNRKKM